MKKSLEIKRRIEELKNEMRTLEENGRIEDAYNKLTELKNLGKELEMALEMEKEQIENFTGTTVNPTNEEIDENVVFNKLVMNRELNEAEKQYVENAVGTPGQAEHTPEKGGYLVPEEQLNTIKELKRMQVPLKDYCNVVKVETMSGKFPVETQQNGKLINFEELNDIKQSEITFAQQAWSLKDYGDIIPVSNTLLKDTRIRLVDYIGKQFAKKAVNTENAEILKLLKTVKTKITGKDYKDIVTALNVKLDPAIAKSSIILTNQSGFDYLDKLEDKNGRPLLTDSLTKPGVKLFKGKEVVYLSDEEYPLDASKYPFYVGDLMEFINFYDREGVEVAQSAHAGFKNNATLLRAIERFDAKIVDADSVVYVTIPVATV